MNNTPQDKRLLKRRRAESRLKAYGIVSICLALVMLITLMTSIGLNGYSALQQAYVKLDVKVESLNVLDEDGLFSKKKALLFNWDGIVRNSFLSNFPDVTKRSEKRALRSLISSNAGYDLRQYFKRNPSDLNKDITVWLTVSDDFDQYLKGRFNTSVPEKDRRLSNQQIEWIKFLSNNGKVDLKFNPFEASSCSGIFLVL